MSQTSCVRHPAEARYLKIYQWQLEFCDGNACCRTVLKSVLTQLWCNPECV